MVNDLSNRLENQYNMEKLWSAAGSKCLLFFRHFLFFDRFEAAFDERFVVAALQGRLEQSRRKTGEHGPEQQRQGQAEDGENARARRRNDGAGAQQLAFRTLRRYSQIT